MLAGPTRYCLRALTSLRTLRQARPSRMIAAMNTYSIPFQPSGNEVAACSTSSTGWGPSSSSQTTQEIPSTNQSNIITPSWNAINAPPFVAPPSLDGPRPIPNHQLPRDPLPSRPKQSTPNNRRVREIRDSKANPCRASGGIPDPTEEYIRLSNVPPTRSPQPQHLLVVIDLNGTLLFRPSRKTPTKFTARPHTTEFLQYCINTFTVVIWSSAQPDNVKNMCNTILTPDLRQRVAAIWGRDKFGLIPEDYVKRVQCYKRLTKVWSDYQIATSHPEFAAGGRWNQTNTVLIDDSFEKGRSEPYNLIEIPEFLGDTGEKGGVLPQVHDYLNYLSMHRNVSACLRDEPFKPILQS